MRRGKDYIGVGVGAFIVSGNGDCFLLLKRRKKPDAGLWSIPGGAVEFGESFEGALEREVFEETGLKVRAGRLLSLTNHVSKEDQTHWIAPQYEAVVLSGEAVNREPDKHEALLWCPLRDVPEQITQETRNAHRRYLAEPFSFPSLRS